MNCLRLCRAWSGGLDRPYTRPSFSYSRRSSLTLWDDGRSYVFDAYDMGCIYGHPHYLRGKGGNTGGWFPHFQTGPFKLGAVLRRKTIRGLYIQFLHSTILTMLRYRKFSTVFHGCLWMINFPGDHKMEMWLNASHEYISARRPQSIVNQSIRLPAKPQYLNSPMKPKIHREYNASHYERGGSSQTRSDSMTKIIVEDNWESQERSWEHFSYRCKILLLYNEWEMERHSYLPGTKTLSSKVNLSYSNPIPALVIFNLQLQPKCL